MITDAVNLICIDTGNENYINQFTIKMQAPTTKEENDRRENTVNRVSLVSDIMNTLTDLENVTTKLKILKSLLSDIVTDQEVISLLQEEIERLEQEEENMQSEDTPSEDEMTDDFSMGGSDMSFPDDAPLDIGDEGMESGEDVDVESEVDETSDETLPSPDDLGVGDMSDMDNPEL
jgi:hypothetical protein